MPRKKTTPRIDSFDFPEGKIIAKKYKVIDKLGGGWEGEVYLLREISTGIDRAGKFFFPQRNIRNGTLKAYAKKLHALRHCPIMITYHTQDTTRYKKMDITFLVSDYVEGELLSDFLKRQPGKRIHIFQALHLLHALAVGFDEIHRSSEYHGDLHTDNIIIQRHGLGFDLKLLDLYHWKAPKKENMQDDICDMIKIFYDALGGQKHYAKQPKVVKDICCGLKRSLILKKFKTAGQLRGYLETLHWS